MLQFTTVVASGWPFLQWPTPSTDVLTVVNVAGGPPPAFADAAGSIASAKSNVVMKTPSFFIPTTPKPPALVRRRLRNAAAEVRPFLAGRTVWRDLAPRNYQNPVRVRPAHAAFSGCAAMTKLSVASGIVVVQCGSSVD